MSATDTLPFNRDFDDFFALLRAAPAAFFAVWLDEPDGSGLAALASVAAGSPAWTGSVVDACLAELLRRTASRQDIFRQDQAATRCLKLLTVDAFTAAVQPTVAAALARLVAKKTCDLAEHASRLLQQLAGVELPPVVHLVARRLLAGFGSKFSGSGRVALVGLFWLRQLCPLLLRLGTNASPKPERSARVVELVKLLQARANDVVGKNAQWQELEDVLDSLLGGSDDWPPYTPPDGVVRPLLTWLNTHALPLGRALKSDKPLFDTFTRNLEALRHWQPPVECPPSDKPTVDHLSKAGKSTSTPSMSRRLFTRPLLARTALSSEALIETDASASPQPPLTPRSIVRSMSCNFSSVDVTPVRTDGVETPAFVAGFMGSREQIEAWSTSDVASWLVNCQLHELVAPFTAAGIVGKQLLGLERRSPVFVDNNVKIGVVHQFRAAQKALLRSTLSVFDSAQFSSPEEQLLAMKELLLRMANRLA